MDPEAFRAAAHTVVDRIADYLSTIESQAVLPAIEPGSVGPLFPQHPPERPEPLADILADVDRLIIPNATHWQHPGFMAYFATTASGPGMLGEFLTAALGQNPMLWRTSPIGTELETVVVGWLREALGLPDTFNGLLTDTASTSTLIALAAAREASGLDAAARGLAARAKDGEPRLYASAEAHSSIEKAAMTLGLGRAAVVKIPVNDDYEMDAEALAMAIETDHRGRALSRRGRRHDRHDVVDVRRPGRRDRRHRRPRGPVAARRRRVCRPGRDHPRAASGVRGLGSGRLDRREPAQVAVHPARRLAAADAPDGPAARRVQPRARVPAHARPRLAGPRLQRVPAAAGSPDARAEAVDAAALVRDRGAAAADRRAPGARGSGSRAGSTRIPTGSAWRRCPSRRSASATGRRR